MSLLNIFKNLFCNNATSINGMSEKDLNDLTNRIKFSSFMPFISYDPEKKFYHNQDNTFGVIWECPPLNFANSKVTTAMEGLLSLPLPSGSVMQFILYADNYIDKIADFAKEIVSKRDNEVLQDTFENNRRFLYIAKYGCKKNAETPLRNFRLFFTIKIQEDVLSESQISDILNNAREILKTSYMPPVDLLPEDLLDWMRRLLNDKVSQNNEVYDQNIAISKQIIFSETDVEKTINHMRFGNKYFKCITPKVFPREVSVLTGANLSGGIWGKNNDIDQIKTPFLLTYNLVFADNLKAKIRNKCDVALQQQAAASFALALAKKKEELVWAVDKIEKGDNFLYVIPVIWAWSDSLKTTEESIAKIRRVWENNGFVMQVDKGILPILFISSLPFGLYTEADNVDKMERYFIAPNDSISPVLPIQADFTGGGAPYLNYFGRKGQFITLDLFDKHADNYNMFVTASTGKGKSFFVNNMASRYYGAGAKIRIVDIGFSYKKLVNIFNGRYIEFKPDKAFSLNPFSFIDDFSQDGAIATMVIYSMIYAGTEVIPFAEAEDAMALVREAVKWAYSKHGQMADLDVVYDYLNTFPDYADAHAFNCEGKEDCGLKFKILAQTLAFRLSDYTTKGTFGKWFNGKSDFNLKNDDFVVIELEHLKSIPALFKIITLQMINALTRDMYLSDRSIPKLAIFDESWQFLRNSNAIKYILEEGYRRARKYLGSFTIITQSILDLSLFGDVGQVILANSAYKYFLESPDFDKAKSQNLIDYDDFTMKVLKSVKSSRPNYSEIFMDTPFGFGVGRLIVDPFSYYVYTSDARDFQKVEDLMKQKGLSYAQAISELAGGMLPEPNSDKNV